MRGSGFLTSPEQAGRVKSRGLGERTFTVVFAGNLEKLGFNPFDQTAPFGKPQAVGFGNIFDERDRLEAALQQIELLPSSTLGASASSFFDARSIASAALRPSPPSARLDDSGTVQTLEEPND